MNQATFSKSFYWFPLTQQLLVWLGRWFEGIFLTIGQAVVISRSVLWFLMMGRLKRQHFFEQAGFVGVDTLGIALILVVFSGMVIAMQVAPDMEQQGAGGFIGALVSIAILRELAPLMTAVAVVSMAGSAFAAELSTMQITQQIDALRSLRVSPVRYLVLPRITAAMVMIPMMTVVTAVSGILAGMVVTDMLTEVVPSAYLESVWVQTDMKDVMVTLLKSSIFGYIIVVLSTTIGINTRGGAKEVGEATTRAVVWSFLCVAIADYVLTYLFYGSTTN